MMEHRAAVRDRLVDQETEGLRKLNLGRDQRRHRRPDQGSLDAELRYGRGFVDQTELALQKIPSTKPP
jgi:hypothetical protein